MCVCMYVSLCTLQPLFVHVTDCLAAMPEKQYKFEWKHNCDMWQA